MTRAALRQALDRLRTSYWFLPVLGALLATALVELMLQLDARVPNSSLDASRFILSEAPDELRALMGSVAASLLATTGIVFTLLTVPLSLAASQFGSRSLRLYQRDSTIQTVLAIFIAAFTYCLFLALAIPADATQAVSPQLSITFGLTLSAIALVGLLVLIHHISSALQAPNLVSAASSELAEVIASTFEAGGDGRPIHQGADTESLIARLEKLEKEGYPIYATKQGYIQAVDVEVALMVATRYDLTIRLVRSPGHFVRTGELIALAEPYANVHRRAAANIGDAYRLGNLRTPAQDLEYAVNQIAEIAIRALSPAINDPYTTMTCLDHLEAGLAVIAARPMPSSTRFDAGGRLRLITDDFSFSELLSAAFNMLRRAARENASVLLAMLDVFEQIGHSAHSDAYRVELSRQVRLVQAESDASSSTAWDKERVNQRCAEVSANLAVDKE